MPCQVSARCLLSYVLGLAAAALFALALSAAPADAASLGKRTLAPGTRGADVRELQRLLRQAGFDSRTDGVFGRGTYRTLRRLERELGLRVDGRFSRSDLRSVLRALRPAEGTGGFGMDEAARSRAATTQEVAGSKARLTEDGLAIPPADAPEAVKKIIAAGNAIARKPYRYGGGHGRWEDCAYDCSGSVSYALYGARLLERPLASGGFTSWAESGPGEWVTVYTKSSHMHMVVAGMRFDTSRRQRTGSRWQKQPRPTDGYVVRHPEGL